METMLSLYDYLGKKAGSELGKAVAQAAKQRNVRPSSKTITNPKYSGTILMYPKSFLDEYFKFPTPVESGQLPTDNNQYNLLF